MFKRAFITLMSFEKFSILKLIEFLTKTNMTNLD